VKKNEGMAVCHIDEYSSRESKGFLSQVQARNVVRVFLPP
jgi:hypothetical protein